MANQVTITQSTSSQVITQSEDGSGSTYSTGPGLPFLTAAQVVSTPAETLVALGSVSGAVNVDLTLGAAFTLTLTGNTVITFTSPRSGVVNYATLRVTQDGVGGHTLDVTGRQGSFAANALANLSSTAGATDEVACESWDAGSHWTVSLTQQGIA